MRMTAKRPGPGGSSAHVTANACKSIPGVGTPKPVNKSLGKEQIMEDRRQRTDITPGDPMERASGWYGKKPSPDSTGIMGGLRRFFG